MTPLHKAAEVVTLNEDFGKRSTEISRALDIPRATVNDILAGRGGWDEITESDPLFKQLRQQQKERWWKSIWSLQPKLLQNIEDKLKESSAASSTWMFGVLFDKERLLAGESTSNISVAHHVEVEDLNEAADRIAHSLLRFSGTPAIDVTPPGDDNSKVR